MSQSSSDEEAPTTTTPTVRLMVMRKPQCDFCGVGDLNLSRRMKDRWLRRPEGGLPTTAKQTVFCSSVHDAGSFSCQFKLDRWRQDKDLSNGLPFFVRQKYKLFDSDSINGHEDYPLEDVCF